jgi:uncharacterized protein YciI
MAAWLRDGPDGAGIRGQHLAAHLDFVERHLDTILVAGPLFDESSGEMNGSLYVLDVGDREAAFAFLERDPYYAAGLWEAIDIRPFRGAAGRWVGGRNW